MLSSGQQGRDEMTFIKTRIEPLALAKIATGEWSFFDMSEGRQSQVGPVYRTKTEALADLDGYAYRSGWVK